MIFLPLGQHRFVNSISVCWKVSPIGEDGPLCDEWGSKKRFQGEEVGRRHGPGLRVQTLVFWRNTVVLSTLQYILIHPAGK